MQVNTTASVHNRGTFQLEDTVFKAGDSSSDRQSRGQTFTPYRQGDTMQFQTRPIYYQTTPQNNPLAWLNRLLNLDLRVYTALIASILISTFIHALFSPLLLLTLVIGILSFLGWYVMSFFNFKAVFNLLLQGPQPHPRARESKTSVSY